MPTSLRQPLALTSQALRVIRIAVSTCAAATTGRTPRVPTTTTLPILCDRAARATSRCRRGLRCSARSPGCSSRGQGGGARRCTTRQLDRDNTMRRHADCDLSSRQARSGARERGALACLPCARRGRAKAREAHGCALRAGAGIGENDDDAAIRVLERADCGTGQGSRRTDAYGARTDIAGPHGKSPEYTRRHGIGPVCGIHKMRCRLCLLDLEALPEEIRGQLRVYHGVGQLGSPREAFVISATTIPRRGEGAAGSSLGVPFGYGRDGDWSCGISGVGVRRKDTQVLCDASIDELGRVRGSIVPTQEVAAYYFGRQPSTLDGAVQDWDELDSFVCICGDLHLRIRHCPVRFIQGPDVRHCNALCGVILHVLHQKVRVGLFPIACTAGIASRTA